MALDGRPGRSRLTLVLLILTSVTLLTLDFRGFGPLDSARGLLGDVLAPVGDATGGVLSPVGDAWNGAFRYGELEEENRRLRQRIDELEGQRSRNAVSEQALRELLAEVDIPWVGDRPTTVARVVAGPTANFDQTVEIDKGSDHGLAEGMAVMTHRGLVGRLVRVGRSRSVVELVTDPQMSVGVRLVSSGDIGVAGGQGAGDPLRVSDIEKTTVVEEGELVATSGLSRSLFPGDIPVGIVVAVQDDPEDPAKTLSVAPLARLDDLGYVTVVLEEPPE